MAMYWDQCWWNQYPLLYDLWIPGYLVLGIRYQK